MRMRQRPLGVLPESAATTPLEAPPKKVAAEEKREVTGQIPGPASARRAVPEERLEAGGNAASPARTSFELRPRGTGVPPAERAESVDPGGIIDWLLNEYPARRQ
jgi:hypothetical protein